ncbi:hypothetical protein X777_09008 [Ooceraea biroi]|uniref:Uncharacterized protein n=1 Tax=Ooceraea biroi TaxID=2015173 RepID=A0A026W8N5_OOCBI|nr:hypothetical protein X777_09008 [Ooceraea biroi]
MSLILIEQSIVVRKRSLCKRRPRFWLTNLLTSPCFRKKEEEDTQENNRFL